MVKYATKNPTGFICKYCGDTFYRLVYPSSKNKCTFDFCSPKCRNKARSLKEIPCPVCGEMFIPRINDINRSRKRYCSNKCVGVAKRSANYLVYEKQRNHVRLPESEYRARVHGAAKKYMTNNNPMHNPKTVEKVRKYWIDHPNEWNVHLGKLMEGHRRIQRDKPTKLELALFSHLDKLGVKYEPYYLIKPKFIVDALIGNNIIIQADGDYWHGHPRFKNPTDRQLAQQKRDKAQDTYLTKCGYKVIRIWESDMSIETVENCLDRHGYLPLGAGGYPRLAGELVTEK